MDVSSASGFLATRHGKGKGGTCLLPRKRLKTGERVARVLNRNVLKGQVRVKLVAPDDNFRSKLIDRTDKNGYIVMSKAEFERRLDPLFAKHR